MNENQGFTRHKGSMVTGEPTGRFFSEVTISEHYSYKIEIEATVK